MRRATLIAAAALAAGASAAGAASFSLASGVFAVSTKTLTHTTCTLTPAVVDTYVNEGSPSTSYQFNSSLTTDSQLGHRERVLIEFDLSKCPSTIANAEVDSATLSLYVSAAAGGTRTLNVYRATSGWAGTVTWNTQPSHAGTATTTFTASASSTGWKSIDVTNDVVDFVQSSPTPLPPYSSTVPNDGWMIDDEGTTTGVVSMTSSEGTAAQRPTLTVAYAY